MVKSEKTIKREIKAHIKKCKGAYSRWYTGITEDPKQRLFTDHKVDKKKNSWIYRKASSDKVARRIEKHFLDVLGTDGGEGGGDKDAVYVYSYKKKKHTKE